MKKKYTAADLKQYSSIIYNYNNRCCIDLILSIDEDRIRYVCLHYDLLDRDYSTSSYVAWLNGADGVFDKIIID